MNYIYDVILNFNNEYLDFFEWNKNDNIINVRKIPVFKIEDQDYLNFKTSVIVVDSVFLNKISNQTTYYTNSLSSKFLCLVTNQKEVMAIMLDKNGKIKMRSGLLFDEAEEVIEISHEIDTTKIKYEVLETKKKEEFLSRSQKEKRSFILNKLKKLEDKNDILALRYLYFDYFETEENNEVKILDSLKKELMGDWKKKNDELYKLILLLSSNKIYK